MKIIMDNEKKYNELVGKIKKAYLYTQTDSMKAVLEDILPELRESEDEKIRKEIISALKYANHKGVYDKHLAWLEKQGQESMKVSIWKHWKDGIAGNGNGEPIFLIKTGNTYTLSSVLSFECDYIELSELDNLQGEQKPIIEMKSAEESLGIDSNTYNEIVDKCIYGDADKVEPKFKVGEWITNGNCTWKIVEVKPLDYILQSQDGNIVDDTISHVDEQFHSFTIEDAKDGDVLASEFCGSIILCKGIENGTIQFYCDYDFSDIDIPGDRFAINSRGQHYGNVEEPTDFQPATKEQRDLLFQKMEEAGYMWDANKKELKKIEQILAKSEKTCKDEQKSTDKAKPKFKFGDWITDGDLHCKISDILDDRYIVDTKFKKRSAIPFKRENNYHLWTIEDAKDGDVLASGQVVFIFKMIHGVWLNCYCSLHNDGSFIANPYDLLTDKYFGEVYPSTNEQHDLLFQKMEEAGYEWNDEKKDMKKIEQKSAWSEEDECYMSECIGAIATKDGWSFEEKRKTKHWLKTLKDRIVG